MLILMNLVHKTRFARHLFWNAGGKIELISDRSSIYVLVESFLPLFRAIFQLDSRTLPTLWYFFVVVAFLFSFYSQSILCQQKLIYYTYVTSCIKYSWNLYKIYEFRKKTKPNHTLHMTHYRSYRFICYFYGSWNYIFVERMSVNFMWISRSSRQSYASNTQSQIIINIKTIQRFTITSKGKYVILSK